MYLAVYSTQARPLPVMTAGITCREFIISARSEGLSRRRKIQPAACAAPALTLLLKVLKTGGGTRPALVTNQQRLSETFFMRHSR
jgi:hypothetical protein